MNIERGGEKEEIDWGGWEGKDGREEEEEEDIGRGRKG